MKRSFMIMTMLMAMSLFSEEVDFNKAKLEKLTKDLSLTPAQQTEMMKQVMEDALFIKEALTIKPDAETVEEIISNRLLRIDLLAMRAHDVLNDQQYAVYLKIKADRPNNDKVTALAADKLSLDDMQIRKTEEIISMVKKLQQNAGMRMPPPDMGGNNRGPQQGGSGDMRQMPQAKTVDATAVFEKAFSSILNKAQAGKYAAVQKELAEQLKKELPAVQSMPADNNRGGGDMRGGPGMGNGPGGR